MKRFAWLVVAIWLVAWAWALEWRSGERVMLFSDDGQLVGIGEVDDDALELEVLENFVGFVQLRLNDEMLEGFINADGSIVIVRDGNFYNLNDDLARFGLTLKLEREARLTGALRDFDQDDDDADDDGDNGGDFDDDSDDGDDDVDDLDDLDDDWDDDLDDHRDSDDDGDDDDDRDDQDDHDDNDDDEDDDDDDDEDDDD